MRLLKTENVSTTIDPYKELANAIIILAAKDYRKARKKLRKKAKRKAALAEIKSLEKFFLSDWYKTLTDVDGEMLLQRLKEEKL